MNDRFDFVVIFFVVLQVTTTVQLQVTSTVVNLVQLESLRSQSASRENLFSKFPCSRRLRSAFLCFFFFLTNPIFQNRDDALSVVWTNIQENNEEWNQIWRNKVYLWDKPNQRLPPLSWSGCCFQWRYVFHVIDPSKPPLWQFTFTSHDNLINVGEYNVMLFRVTILFMGYC